MAEAVNHPPHYGGGDNPYEAIKVIEAWGLDFNLGNTVKYIARADKKGKQLEDLRKARWYLNREIGLLEDSMALSDREVAAVLRAKGRRARLLYKTRLRHSHHIDDYIVSLEERLEAARTVKAEPKQLELELTHDLNMIRPTTTEGLNDGRRSTSSGRV